MKERVIEDSQKTVRQVFNEVLHAAVDNLRGLHSEELLGRALPTYDSIATILQRTRNNVRPPLPKSMGDISLEDPWTKTWDGREFLLFDNSLKRDKSDRILGFSTDELIECLCSAETIVMDGTFRAVPSLFRQLCSLHVIYHGQMIPVVYFLLPDKEKITYSRMFGLIQTCAASLNVSFKPMKFLTDFEAAILQSIHEVFPEATRKGCLFHFSQCIWRSVQEQSVDRLQR